MNVLELAGKLTLDAQEYLNGLSEAEDAGNGFANGLSAVMSGAAAAVAAVSGAVVALGAAIYKQTKATAEYGDKVDKASQRMGISTEAYQEWAYVLDLAGGSIDGLEAGMRTLSRVLVEAADGSQSAFEALEAVGLAAEDLEGMTLEDQLNTVIGALGEMESGAERTAAAQALLGRGAMDLGPLLNMTQEDIEAVKQEAHDLGMIMSEEDVAASATLMDSLTRFEGTLRGIRNTIFSEFLPGITQMIDGFTALMTGSEDATDQIMAGFRSVVDTLTENVPEFGKVAVKLVFALVDGIMANLDEIVSVAIDIIFSLVNKIIELLPELARAAVQIILTLVNKLIDELPRLIDTALELVLTLADGIADALPQLIPAVVQLILTIVRKLTAPDMALKLVDAAVQIIIGLAEGLISALPELIEYVPEIIVQIVMTLIQLAPQLIAAAIKIIGALATGIVNNIPKVGEAFKNVFEAIKKTITGWFDSIKEWGKDMIRNFVQGIKDMMQSVKDAVGKVGEQIKDLLGFSEPKEGPLSNFHTFAPDMMKLFAKGIKDNEDLIQAQIEQSFDIQGNIRAATGNGGSEASTGLSGAQNDRPINITVQSVLDGRVVAESVYKYQRSQQRVYGR